MSSAQIAPKAFVDYVRDHREAFISRLKEAVEIPSVSSDTDRRPDVIRMSGWMQTQLKKYGVDTAAIDLGMAPDGLKLPPVIVGRIGTDPKKKTVLVYGHLDVQPARKEDGWKYDPFTLTVENGSERMYGRGSTDDKGPVMAWLNVLEAHHELGMELPVNMRFCFEAMEESSSEGLDDFIVKEAAKGDQGWFDKVDCVCISDNYWLNTKNPCLTYGLRGIVYVNVWIGGPKTTLHSGIYGGMVYEPMTALIALLNTLVEQNAKITVTDAYKGISPPTEQDVEATENIHYKLSDLLAITGDVAVSDDVTTLLMNRMLRPSLTIHGIEGAVSDPGTVTIIPNKVAGKFSMRIVPPQTPASVKQAIDDHLRSEFKKLGTKCIIEDIQYDTGDAWVTDFDHWNYAAAAAATREVWGMDPDFTREGGSIPVTLTFADNIKGPDGKGANVLLLPLGRGDDGAHSINEKMDISNYICGSQLLGTYLYAIAQQKTT